MTAMQHELLQTGTAADTGSPGRRYVTLVFADLSHSTELSDAMETEHYAALLAALRKIYQQTIVSHGGTIVRVQGDGLLAMWGYPHTREHDGRTAVEAALDLHRQVAALQSEMPGHVRSSLHTGIHSGLVLVASGDIERGRFELMGAVPNVAARLSDAALPDEILVSIDTLGPSLGVFDTDPPRELRIKGREGPLLVCRVHARRAPGGPWKAREDQKGTPFVGRREELARLELLLAGVAAGQVHSVCVCGAAGMGKTRLIEQLLARATQAGMRVLRGYCESDLGAQPLQPFRHMLQSLDRDTPLPKTAEDFTALFGQLAGQLPLLLFVDDAQWADNASGQVLTALKRLSGCRLLLVLAARTSDITDLTDQTIALAPLSDAEAGQAIGLRWPGADPFVAREIVRSAGGNPLFIEELCHSAARGENTRAVGRMYAGAGWLSQLVESRVQHLGQDQAELVRIAAIIGNVIPTWLLEFITGHREDSPLVQALAEHDFVYPGERAGTLRFKHGITHDIIYDSVGLHARQQLHLRVAEAIWRQVGDTTDEAHEALAHHFGSGGSPERAAHYAELAGHKALAASALDRARAQYRAALAALDHLPMTADLARRWVAIAQKLGLVSAYDPNRSELALADRAVELACEYGDTSMVALARCWQGYMSFAVGDTLAAIEHEQRALTEARHAGNAPLATQIVAALGQAHTAAAHYGHALLLLNQAIGVWRRHHTGRHTNAGLSYSLVCKAYGLGDRGLFKEAYACFDEALASIVGGGHEVAASTHGWRAAVLLWQGRWADARDAALTSGQVAEATRSLSQLSIARAIGGYAEWMLTRDPASLQVIVDATAWLEPRESGLFRSLNHGWLSDGLFAAGRRREARHHAALALLRVRQRDLIGVAMAYRALARDAAARRDATAARRYIRLALRTAQQRDSAHEIAVTALCEAEVAFLIGDRSSAGEILERAALAFEKMEMPWHLQQAALLRANLTSE